MLSYSCTDCVMCAVKFSISHFPPTFLKDQVKRTKKLIAILYSNRICMPVTLFPWTIRDTPVWNYIQIMVISLNLVALYHIILLRTKSDFKTYLAAS